MMKHTERGVRGAVAGGLVALCGIGILAFCPGVAVAHPVPDAQRKVRKSVAPPPVEIAPIQVEVQAAPAPPPPPLTPGQMAPKPPGVSYEDGQLTIVAENSTMADILSAVAGLTGAAIEVPPGAGSERVWVQLGPGPARAVLAALLGGTDLDFVIQAADEDPTRIQSVLLTPRIKGGPTTGSDSSQSFASRFSDRFRARANGSADATSDPDVALTDTPVTAPPIDAAAGTPASPSSTPGTPDPSMGQAARLPASITEAQAHPAPTGDPQQGVPQLMNLFELRRQIQEQANAQAKATGATR